MITLSQLNNVKVNPVAIQNIDRSRVKGVDLFQELYSNIFICARKKSGKSTVIFNILKHCADKNTRIIIFASNVNKDPTYKAIDTYFTNLGNTILTYTSIKENGQDNLQQIVEMLRDPEENKEEATEDTVPFIITNETKNYKKKKQRKPKYVAPEIIFIFDDLNTELRSQSISMLLKSNRHYKCKVIISSQYVHDLQPASLLQLDYMLIFKGQSEEKLEVIHKQLDLSLPFELFREFYDLATEVKYNFFYIDKNDEEYRINFNKSINVN